MSGIKMDVLLGKLREKDGFGSGSTPKLFSGNGDPNGVVTPTKAGDMYLDNLTGGIWINGDGTINGWKEYNYMTS